MSKLHIISDKNRKSSKIKNLLIKKIKSTHFKKENLIIVIGGDGFMLKTLKKYHRFNKPFYGVNCGSYGFLMNKYLDKDLQKKIKRSKQTIINPLDLIATNKNNINKKIIAIKIINVFIKKVFTSFVIKLFISLIIFINHCLKLLHRN